MDDAPIGRLAARAAKGRQDAPQKRSHWSPKSAPEAPPEIAKRRPTGAPIGGPEAPQKSRQKSPRGVPEALPMLVQRRPRRAARDRQEASQRRPRWSLRSAPSRGLSRGVPEASILVAQRRPRSAAKGRQEAPILVAQRRPRSAAKGRQPREALMRGLPTTNIIYTQLSRIDPEGHWRVAAIPTLIKQMSIALSKQRKNKNSNIHKCFRKNNVCVEPCLALTFDYIPWNFIE